MLIAPLLTAGLIAATTAGANLATGVHGGEIQATNNIQRGYNRAVETARYTASNPQLAEQVAARREANREIGRSLV